MKVTKGQLKVVCFTFIYLFIHVGIGASLNISASILQSFKKIHGSDAFKGSVYNSMAIINLFRMLGGFVSPIIMDRVGVRIALLSSCFSFFMYVAALFYPITEVVYLVAAINGVGTSLVWVASGEIIARFTKEDTKDAAAIFNTIFQFYPLIGNAFVYYTFKGETSITEHMRYKVIGILAGFACLGTLEAVFFPIPSKVPVKKKILRDLAQEENILPIQDNEANENTELLVSKRSTALTFWQLCTCRSPLCLLEMPAFFGCAFLNSTLTGVYGTCLGNTMIWGNKRKGAIGLHGMLLGIGKISGGFVGIPLSHGQHHLKILSILAFVFSIIPTYIIPFNLPANSPMEEVYLPTSALLFGEDRTLALVCSFVAGLGDSLFQSAMTVTIALAFNAQSADMYGIMNVLQGAGGCIMFFYSGSTNLYFQFSIIATAIWLAWTGLMVLDILLIRRD